MICKMVIYYLNATNNNIFSSTHYEAIEYYLEYSQQGTRDGVEIRCWCSIIKIEVTTKQLHSKESKDEDEEKEEK